MSLRRSQRQSGLLLMLHSTVNESPLDSSCTDTLSLSSSSLSSDGDASFMSPKRLRIDDTYLTSPGRDSSDDSCSQAKELVKQLLETKPGGEKILREYRQTNEVKDPLRRKLVNIVVAAMIEKYGSAPPMDIRTRYALGIVTLFPCLKDPYSQKGYEHFFDAQSNEGYIAWKLKNMQRELSSGSRRDSANRGPSSNRGPQFERQVTAEHQLEGDQCREALSLLRHSTDEGQIFTKMKQTFHYRQKLIHEPERSCTVLNVFPRFLDTKGLILQDFQLLLGEETSSKLMEKWGTFLKPKVIKEASNLTKTAMLDSLIHAAEENPDDDEELPAWDSDMAALLLLVYLLPPPPSGKKRAVKITVKEALSHVVKFHKSCRSLQDITSSEQRRQPYILAVGTSRNSIHDYYIVLDGQLIPCKAKSSLPAFDELFKAHYVFGISYDQALNNMYTFVQTTIYNIDVGLCHESPRVKDLRAKLLN
ncbi:uncharacterized protein LOC117821555 [Notolabrus celidotus]|uniref:uncharacterized protein LOC117821555 n=1 Tax=Notolabrus celidotus TaxID=1203425 RepID=UPI0014901B50|nr:uncharacterized protein LOC117821555 [Notolabrus celidotus]